MTILFGFVVLVVLLVPIRLYLALGFFAGSIPFGSYPALPAVVAILVAQAMAAILFYSAAREVRVRNTPEDADPAKKKRYGRALISGLLGLVLLAKSFHILYWLIVWDSTYDPIGVIWVFLLVFLVPIIWLLTANLTSGSLRRVALLLVPIMPLLIVGFALPAGRVDFRHLTATRAERISRAVENYHAREGEYPEKLSQLVPRDAVLLPAPVIIFGQRWCYEAGAEFYRLGYVDRQHWSDPNLFGHLYRSKGDTSGHQTLCAAEIAALRSQHPDFFSLTAD